MLRGDQGSHRSSPGVLKSVSKMLPIIQVFFNCSSLEEKTKWCNYGKVMSENNWVQFSSLPLLVSGRRKSRSSALSSVFSKLLFTGVIPYPTWESITVFIRGSHLVRGEEMLWGEMIHPLCSQQGARTPGNAPLSYRRLMLCPGKPRGANIWCSAYMATIQLSEMPLWSPFLFLFPNERNNEDKETTENAGPWQHVINLIIIFLVYIQIIVCGYLGQLPPSVNISSKAIPETSCLPLRFVSILNQN